MAGPERYVICLRAPFQRAFLGSTNGATVLRRRLHKICQNRLNLETLLGARVADPAQALETRTEGLTGTWRCTASQKQLFSVTVIDFCTMRLD